MIIAYTSIEESLEVLIAHVYPEMSMFETAPFEMMKRTILCSKNEFVDDINSRLIERFPGKEIVYTSNDRTKSGKDQGDLNTLEPKGLPQHKLVLKMNSPIILLRNINPVEGLCNGTRLICKTILTNVVGAVIATGQFKGKHVWIPKIPLEANPAENKYLIPFVRRQILVRLCFAMTINKSQGQTLYYVGLYLKQPVFSHGHLYVGLSRAKTGTNVKILIIPPTCHDPVAQAMPNMKYFLDNLTLLGLIHDSLINDGQSVDIMHIIIKAEESRNVNTDNEQTTFQNFKIVDADKKPIQLTMWGELTSTIGPYLMEASRNYEVVVAKRLKVTRSRYGVITVRGKNSSSFAVDPPIEAASGLKSWFDSMREIELPQLLED
ncbi:DNA helicase [Lithospermum erythrorhizon]|uniref:DNA helicase n=1 Tax=Lithospermum erythrorhizon TaxID=34254 RepID=A0AAV3QYU5_LITER